MPGLRMLSSPGGALGTAAVSAGLPLAVHKYSTRRQASMTAAAISVGGGALSAYSYASGSPYVLTGAGAAFGAAAAWYTVNMTDFRL